MRLSDARVRCHPAKLIYPNHQLPPWLTEDAARDHSSRLLGVGPLPSRRERRPFYGKVGVADGTRPYRLMTATSATLSGGPPALTTAATSLKYWAPISGDWMTRARATLPNGLENA